MISPSIYFEIEQEIKQTPVEYLPTLLNILHAFREGVCANQLQQAENLEESAIESFKAGVGMICKMDAIIQLVHYGMTSKMTIEIFYADAFKRNARRLLKKYSQFSKDVDNFIQQLQVGEISGDLIQHVGLDVYKARIKNSDNQKGKSASYRVIYYLKKRATIFSDDLFKIRTIRC